MIFDNGNLLTYKCKYYNIVQCSDLCDFINRMGFYTFWSPTKECQSDFKLSP